jgi:hypothetical protein
MGYGIYFKLHGRHFSSNFQHFNTFRPLFQKLLEINVKFKRQTCLACQDLLTMQFWSKLSRSWHVKYVCTWHVKHVCNLNLTFISISFWNKGGKVLKCQTETWNLFIYSVRPDTFLWYRVVSPRIPFAPWVVSPRFPFATYRDDSCMQKKNHSFWSTLNIYLFSSFKFLLIRKINQTLLVS